MKLLLIDNYDSFTFNLLHYFQIAGAEMVVRKNDEVSDAEFQLQGFDGAVLSPGPCTPSEAGCMPEFLKQNAGQKPIFGVCLGMQAIGILFGWKLNKARVPVHGKPSVVELMSHPLFEGIGQSMQVGRYHSLVIQDPGNTALHSIATCEGEVMAVAANEQKLCGVQFHPESILTPQGQQLIGNWLSWSFT